MTCIRIRVHFEGSGPPRRTLIGFDRAVRSDGTISTPRTMEDLVEESCKRLLGNGNRSPLYGLFVSHKGEFIQVFETSDLKDDDECQLKFIDDNNNISSLLANEDSTSVKKEEKVEEPITPDKNVSSSSNPTIAVKTESLESHGALVTPIRQEEDSEEQSNENNSRNGHAAQKGKGTNAEDAIEINDDSDSVSSAGDSSVDEDEDTDDEDSYDDDGDGDSDDDHVPYTPKVKAVAKAPRKTRKAKKEIESTIEVILKDRDMPVAPATFDDEMPDEDFSNQPVLEKDKGARKSERAVKEKIMKLLNTSLHSTTNENEVKNAMKLAQKLMRRHNLCQALMLKEREEQNEGNTAEGSMKGGIVTVEIVNRKTRKPTLRYRWFGTLENAICIAFDVKTYHSVRRGKKCTTSFYGIYTNAQLAGYAFKVVAEKMCKMQAEYTPDPSHRFRTAASRLSYICGIGKGLDSQAKDDKKKEEEARKRKIERAQIAQSQGEAYEESDASDGENDDCGYTFPDEAVPRNSNDNDASSDQDDTKSHSGEDIGDSARPNAQISADVKLKELEREQEAAIILADQTEKVQEEVLKDKGIKLYAGRKRKSMKDFDRNSFDQGQEDSKQIDLKQRAIKEDFSKKVKRENGDGK